MKDEQCVRFLQWALPQLQLCWRGFRKVRRQVCKRVDRRLRSLGLTNVEAYQAYLEIHASEWQCLDSMCRITISRFFRDKGVFPVLEEQVLPSLLRAARERGDTALRIWSAGCASGEEPYTLAIMWAAELQSRFPGMTIDVVATDADPEMIRRAGDAEFKFSSLKDLPDSWRDLAFVRKDDVYLLRTEYRRNVQFLQQDIREQLPEGRFDLVLCRNLVYTYFDDALQLEMSKHIVDSMCDGAALVLGAHEHLPKGVAELTVWFDEQRVYRKNRSV